MKSIDAPQPCLTFLYPPRIHICVYRWNILYVSDFLFIKSKTKLKQSDTYRVHICVYLQSTGIQYVSDTGKSPILVYPGFIDFAYGVLTRTPNMTLTMVIIWENGIIECNDMCKGTNTCQISNTPLIWSVGVVYCCWSQWEKECWTDV